MGIRERGGDLRLIHIESPTSEKLSEQLRNHVDPKVKMIITDELQAYPSAMMVAGIRGGQHETIKHRDHVYVRGEIYTNTVESAFSLFKRGLVGAFHKISLKHLQRYLNEFSFRFNNRKSADLFGMTVRRLALVGNLPYAKLVEGNDFRILLPELPSVLGALSPACRLKITAPKDSTETALTLSDIAGLMRCHVRFAQPMISAQR